MRIGLSGEIDLPTIQTVKTALEQIGLELQDEHIAKVNGRIESCSLVFAKRHE